jgi:hypothetical protein
VINTFEDLFEFMAQKIEAAQGQMPERDRAMLIADAVYEAAFFILQVTPTSGHHQAFLATELLKRLRNFNSPYFVIAREMGDADQLRALFDGFLTATEGWESTHH